MAHLEFAHLYTDSSSNLIFELTNKAAIVNGASITYAPGTSALKTAASVSDYYVFKVKLCEIGERYAPPDLCLKSSRTLVRAEAGLSFENNAFKLSPTASDPLTIEAWLYFSYSDPSKFHPLLHLATSTERVVLGESAATLSIHVDGSSACGPSIPLIA